MLKTLDYTITGTGWAEMVIGDDDGWVSITISYICDPIEEIIDALIRLYRRQSRLEFIRLNAENYETVLLFTVVNDDHIMRLEVIENAYFDQLDPLNDKTHKPMPIFTSYMDVGEFYDMFKNTMNKLIAKKGLEKYNANWRGDFPMEAFKKMT